MLRNINLKDALVAILSLQYILIMTFGDGITGEMQTVCAISTFAVWTTLIVISIANLKSSIKLKKSI